VERGLGGMKDSAEMGAGEAHVRTGISQRRLKLG
jgi:hypothetical protein